MDREGRDLLHTTYFMIDWEKEPQRSAGFRCQECGKEMTLIGPLSDESGRKYDGFVCHNDRRLLWVARG